MNTIQTLDPMSQDFPIPKWSWTREAFQRLADAGIFSDEDRVELIEGEIIRMSPPNPDHSGCVNPTADLLREAFGSGAYVRTEQPLVLGGRTQPQPDVLVCRGAASDYRHRFPVAADVLLAVEIADSSLQRDRIKGGAYAQAGIAEYWIVDMIGQCLEVYRDPDGPQYLSRRIYRIHDSVSPLAAAISTVAVADLFGI